MLLVSLPGQVKADLASVEAVAGDSPILLLRSNETPSEKVAVATFRAGAADQDVGVTVLDGVSQGVPAPATRSNGPNLAAAFDGQRGAIIVQQSSEYDASDLPAEFAIELWVKPAKEGGTYQNLVAKGNQADDARIRYTVLYFGQAVGTIRTGTIRFDCGGNAQYVLDSNTAIPVGKWTHLAITYTPEHGGDLNLYINGQLDAQRTGLISSPAAKGEPLVIGALSINGPTSPLVNHFRGELDEIAIFDHALSPERVRAHFVGQIAPAPQFEKDIRPILEKHCYACHSEDAHEAELDLRTVTGMLRGGTSGPAITRGASDASLLVELLSKGEMPPKGEEKPTAWELALVSFWVDRGALTEESVVEPAAASLLHPEDRQFWAFQRPTKAPIPVVQQPQRVRSPIDAFLLARLEAQGLNFSADADRLTLLRRASFDLLGLPPSLEEMDAFLSDTAADAYERLLDRLLESPHYGERWGRHWLDAAGYVDNRYFDGDAATVYVNENIWRYRDYVVRSLNADKPFDRFITQQLAGDELVDWQAAAEFTDEIRDSLIATGYLRSIEDHTADAQYGIEKRYEVLFGVMEMVSSGLLGLTLECCRCHNHKYDPIPQADYYRMMAAFEPAMNVHNWKKPDERFIADVPLVQRAAIDKQNAQIDRKTSTISKYKPPSYGRNVTTG